LELLIWDFNGTMLDDQATAYGSVEYIFSLYNRPAPTRDRFRNLISGRFMEFCHDCGVPSWASADHLNVIRQDYYLARMNHVHFRPGITELITWSRTMQLKHAICSAEIKMILDTLIDRDKLRQLFEPDGIRAEAWNGKAVELREVCQRLGVACDRSAYLDDTADGITAAKEAGVLSIGFVHPTAWNTAQRIEAAKPNYVVHDFRELRILLEVLASA